MSEKYAGLIALIDGWLADNSDYDEATWPVLKTRLEEDGILQPEPVATGDKLTASVVVPPGGGFCARLAIDRQGFRITPAYRVDEMTSAEDCARHMAAMLTKAIATHDAAVNAELTTQRDKLVAMCREIVVGSTSTTGTYFDQPSTTACRRCHDRWPRDDFDRLHTSGCLIARCTALVAEVEKSHE